MYAVFPLIKQYLSGTTASSVNEARLGYEQFNNEVHICAPGYKTEDFEEIAKYCKYITFNSITQWHRFKKHQHNTNQKLSYGIRVNPEFSEVTFPIYDPCAKYSRLGITQKEINNQVLDPEIEGIQIGRAHV